MILLYFFLSSTFAGIVKYTGIPYAQAPVGELRWKKPVSHNLTLLEAIDARINENREACIQADGTGAEDCLYLDIVKPDSIPPDTLLPIYFWIHGGSFRNGAAAYYPGDALAYSEEMIVVTIQYRLGPLGFLNYPRSMGSEVPLNIGLHDQRMALKFIFDHAESIGGDPNRITVAGESAGSISVSAHAFAPPSSQFIAQTIQQSGTAALGSPAEWTNLNMEKLVQDLCESLYCPAWEDFNGIIQYLRTIEFGSDEFYTMYFALSSSGADIVTDDREFFGGETLQEIIDAKSFKVMPTLIFFVAFEGYVSIDTFPVMYNKDNFMNVWTDDMFLTLLMSHNSLTNEDKIALTWRSFGKMSCDFPDETPATFENIDNTTAVRVALDIIGDLLFRGPAVKCAGEYHAVGADTWVMHFDTMEEGSMMDKVIGESLGPINHNDSSPLWSKKRRAPHAAELKHLFGWGGGSDSVTEFMLNSWRSFVTTGNPSWGSYNLTQYDGFEQHVEIENDENGTVVVRNDERFDFDAFLFFDRNNPTPAMEICTTPTQKPTVPPTPAQDTCTTVTVSGIASTNNMYFFNGDYKKESKLINNAPVFTNGGWKIAIGNDGMWEIKYKNEKDAVAWGVVDDVSCPAINKGWTWWNGELSALSDDKTGVVVTINSSSAGRFTSTSLVFGTFLFLLSIL